MCGFGDKYKVCGMLEQMLFDFRASLLSDVKEQEVKKNFIKEQINVERLGSVEVIRMIPGSELYKKFEFYSADSPHMSMGIDRNGGVYTYLQSEQKFIYSRRLLEDLKDVANKIFEILDNN